jgi:Domain of unknown function (DUF4124)
VRHSGTTAHFARRRTLLLCVLLAWPACLPRADEVYKSVDAEGHVVYSDRPVSSAAQKTVVKVDRPDAKEVARMGKEQEILKAEEIQRNRQKLIDDANKAQQDQAKQAQCDAARNHYYLLKDARRIYQRDADGNRVYYTDAEANVKREEARQAMNVACAS